MGGSNIISSSKMGWRERLYARRLKLYIRAQYTLNLLIRRLNYLQSNRAKRVAYCNHLISLRIGGLRRDKCNDCTCVIIESYTIARNPD